MTPEICRICGSNENLKHVFREGTDELLDQIRLCANIQIDALDCLPKHVCNVCEQGLAFSYRLRKRGEETEKKLRQELLDATKNESYSPDEENQIEEVGEALIEESCDNQLWIKDEDSEHFNADDDLILNVDDGGEDILQVMPEEQYDGTDQWVELQNEDYSETGEIIEKVGIEKVEVDFMELIYDNNDVVNDLDQTETEIEPTAPKLKIYSSDDSQQLNTDLRLTHKTYKSRSNLSKTEDLKRLHCELCPKVFKTISHLNVHKKSHSKVKSYSCEICGKKMRYQGNLRVHMRTVHKNLTIDDLEKEAKKMNQNESLSIAQCLSSMPEKCKEITDIFLHDRCKIFKCTVCGKLSNFKATHIAHCRIHLNEKPFQCKFCEKSFRQLATLKEHEVIHSGKRPYKCTMCNSSFLQKSALTKHEFWHTGKRPFECSMCGTTFRDRVALRVHERIHTGEKPYSCEICKQKFREKRQVARHKQMCHSSGNDERAEKSYKKSVYYHCTWKNCRQKFVMRLSLVSHVLRHITSKHSTDMLKCGDCHKEFLKPIYIWHHQRIYKGTCVSRIGDENPFEAEQRPIKYLICRVCSKKFTSAVALARHRRVHLSLRQHKCANCHMTFRHRYSLNLHMRKHTLSKLEIVPVYERYILDVGKKIQLNEKESLCCPHCSERLSDAELLENHIFCYHDNL